MMRSRFRGSAPVLLALVTALGFPVLPRTDLHAQVESAGNAEANIIATGERTLLLRSDGKIWRWGAGEGSSVDRRINDAAFPAQVGTANDWQRLDAAFDFAVALKSDGSLWSWGLNPSGNLGNGTTNNASLPTRIGTDNDWLAFAVGRWHVIALKTDRSLWSWGYNGSGELGTGGTTPSPSPVRVGTDNDWKRVFAGVGFSFAEKADGTLWAWGWNIYGQLATGDFNDRHVPTRVGTAVDWLDLYPGNNYVLALKRDHTLWGWGLNDSGQLGDGVAERGVTNPANNRNVPIRIGSGWQTAAGGRLHSVGIKSDGSLWSWGTGIPGGLGLGDPYFTNVPTRIGTRNDWISVSAGEFHTVALDRSGQIWVWGLNSLGQLGIVTTKQVQSVRVPMLLPGFSVDGFKLNSNAADGKLTISWSPSAVGYTLESAPAVQEEWSEVAEQAATVGSAVGVTIEIAGKERFFRLRK